VLFETQKIKNNWLDDIKFLKEFYFKLLR